MTSHQQFYEALAFRESLGKPRAVNQVEFVGLYQMGEAALVDTGYNESCFAVSTPIALANGMTKQIQHVRLGDGVLSPNGLGELVPSRVTKLFENTTQEFVRLSFSDGREDLIGTPGHRFMTETGDFMQIGDMLQLGGGTARVVDQDGSIITVTGEMLTYSAETAGMFEQAA